MFKQLKEQLPLLMSLWLLCGLLLLHYSTLLWLAKAYAGMYDQFNVILLIAIVVLFGIELNESSTPVFQKLNYELKILPFGLFISAIIGYFICHYYLDINIISAVWLAIGIYAYSGFLLPVEAWKKIAVPCFLIILTLPFGSIMDLYIGFPLRLMAADLVEQMLFSLNIDSISSETIITIENRSTQINMNCSGMKGLWAACLFFFVISWLHKLSINLKWFLLLLLSCTLVIFFNLLRILLLVLVELVLNEAEIAEAIHTPLGLIGFSFSCACIWAIVHFKFSKPLSSKKAIKAFSFKLPFHATMAPAFSLILLVVLSLAIALKPSPQVREQLRLIPEFSWPQELQLNPLPLSESEKGLFTKDSSYSVKRAFEYQDMKGSFLLVFNASWRGHHPPELCAQASGLKVNKTATYLIQPDFPVKRLSINQDSLSASFWFQSPNTVTDDYSTRVWEEVSGKEKVWVMTTLLFEGNPSAQSKDYRDLLKIIHTQINNHHQNYLNRHESI